MYRKYERAIGQVMSDVRISSVYVHTDQGQLSIDEYEYLQTDKEGGSDTINLTGIHHCKSQNIFTIVSQNNIEPEYGGLCLKNENDLVINLINSLRR